MQNFKLKDYISYLNPQENISIIYRPHDEKCDVHKHEFVELIFIAEGTCIQYIDDEKYNVEPGDLLFVNYGQTHAFEEGESLRYYNLLYVPEYFSAELIHSESIYEIFAISIFKEFKDTDKTQSQIVHFKGNEFLYIKRLIEDMVQEFTSKETGYQSVLNGCSRVIFSKILRKLKAENSIKDTDKYNNQIMAECLEYINERCFGKITLKEIAERAFYNPSYFSRIFHAYCGKSLSEYIKEKRITEAGRLLENTNLSLTEVMIRVGYSDKKHFLKNFKEIYHQTPTQFRSHIQENNVE